MDAPLELHFYVEDVSTEAALQILIALILKDHQEEFAYKIYAFQGKPDLLKKLPQRLQPYSSWIEHNPNLRIIVLVDRDDEDCRSLKQRLEAIAEQAHLVTRTAQPDDFQLINRIAIEELEAWFFGDVTAIRQAYPKIPQSLASKQKFRDPDAITGGTSEALERELKHYHPGGLEKSCAASDIAKHMNPDINRSTSFQVFRDALRQLFG